MFFHGPSETHLDILIGQALFADGAGATIIGANPDISIEHPLFELVLAQQSIILTLNVGLLDIYVKRVQHIVSLKIYPKWLVTTLRMSWLKHLVQLIGISDWNSLFYIVHPGGPKILDDIQQNLGLKEEKLRASRHVLSEYGNMAGPCVIFVLDEMKKSMEEGKTTTGDGLEWGVLFGFGLGLTVETIVLRSIPIDTPCVSAHDDA